MLVSYSCLVLAYTCRFDLCRGLIAQEKNWQHNIPIGRQHWKAQHHYTARAAPVLLSYLSQPNSCAMNSWLFLVTLEACRGSQGNLSLQKSCHSSVGKEASSSSGVNYFIVNSGSKFASVQGSWLHATYLMSKLKVLHTLSKAILALRDALALL